MTDAAKKSGGARRPVLVVLAILALAGYGGYRLYLLRQPYEWSGTVEVRTITVGSRAAGRIKEVLVREGDTVKAGEPLLILEPGDWLAQLAQAEGQLAQMKANLEKLEHGARPEELDEAHGRTLAAQAALAESKAGPRLEQIQARDAALVAAEVAVERARIDADRLHAVHKLGSGAVSQADIDAADLALKAASANRDMAREQAREYRNGSRREDIEQAQARAIEIEASEKLLRAGTRAEDLALARGQVAAAKGKVDEIRTMVDELVIRSPRPARVESCDLRPGDILAANATAATLLEEDQLYVRIYVPETEIGHIKVGQTVPIMVDSFPGRTFEGVVERINGVGEYSPRNLQTADERANQLFGTRIGVRSGRDELRAGMAAFIQVPK